ncbi:MAG TPA: helicase-related protein, partial [Planctomycetaceae bacterium]|nr:helicase-related protein [Planctomycetaceae bacterium]
SVAYEYGILEGINDGWLVPIKQEFVQVDGLNFDGVRTRCGDLAENELEQLMMLEENAHQIVTPTLEIVGDRPTLFFGVTVAHALQMEEIINRHRPGSAVCIHGKTPKDERKQRLAEFARGQFQYLVGCGVFTEGFDEPTLGAIAIARPTKSRALYSQMIGRGTRPLSPPMQLTPDDRRAAIAASAKPDVLVLDFVGNSTRHKLISTADILGGAYDDAVLELAVEIVKLSPESKNMQQALHEAEAEIVARQKAEEEARARRAELKAKATFKRAAVNPFDIFDIMAPRVPGYLQGTPATDRQKEVLRKNGIEPDKYNTREAGKLIDQIFERRTKGLCTYKQAKLLHKFGQPTDVGFTEASAIIDAIAKNGWKPIEKVSV